MSEEKSPYLGLTDAELYTMFEESRQRPGEPDQTWAQRARDSAAQYRKLAAERRADAGREPGLATVADVDG
jgi:hypothetical protein